eukprot:TRINITY_DN46102_c0_g1_i1.p1 TRINITY_DN46102_c0_g1~~TRINITY_DN46102_c0_g1_i1.p1  ORF type:complete len:337 (+),score=44.59 TRINITY_DN46102_c0_g1_i1:83-1093(+)
MIPLVESVTGGGDPEMERNANHVALMAFALSIISGLSLPLGSALGLALSPVSDEVCAGVMAFGGGALLFAVTVELFGHSVFTLKEEGVSECFLMGAKLCGGIVGALLYLVLNRLAEKVIVGGKDVENATEESPLILRKIGSSSDQFKPGALVRRKSICIPIEVDEEQNAILCARKVAVSMFMGILIDGVPEGILMGFLAAEGRLHLVFLVALFVANFPEAFSSSSLLTEGKVSPAINIGMWTGLCLTTGMLTGISCWLLLFAYPDYPHGASLGLHVLLPIDFVEGLTGGAMMACIAAVLLPEALQRSNKSGLAVMSPGFLCTCGFLTAVALKAYGG